jgi:hypothetical protein
LSGIVALILPVPSFCPPVDLSREGPLTKTALAQLIVRAVSLKREIPYDHQPTSVDRQGSLCSAPDMYLVKLSVSIILLPSVFRVRGCLFVARKSPKGQESMLGEQSDKTAYRILYLSRDIPAFYDKVLCIAFVPVLDLLWCGNSEAIAGPTTSAICFSGKMWRMTPVVYYGMSVISSR